MRLRSLFQSNVISVQSAPFKITLPTGKVIQGLKRDILPLCRKHGITRIYSRAEKQWVLVDLKSGKLAPLPEDYSTGVAQQ